MTTIAQEVPGELDETLITSFSVEEPEFYDPFAPRTLRCFSCQRLFAKLDDLRQHLRSRAHLDRYIQCFFCYEYHPTAASVVNHLETKACPRASQYDTKEIFELMKTMDPKGYVTNVVMQVEPAVVPKDQNGTQVYSCTVCNHQYSTSEEASDHVEAKHTAYHCPNTYQCNRQYASLADAVIHFETGTCGYTPFNLIQSTPSSTRGSRHRYA